jgi:Protein of unknown function (DUF4239)
VAWIVGHLSGWAVAAIVVLGIPALAIAIQSVLRRRAVELRRGRHNDVAGFLVAVVGVIYAVLVGFLVVSLWDTHVAVSDNLDHEASLLNTLTEGSDVFGAATSTQIRQDVLAYAQAVVTGWHYTENGEAYPLSKVALDNLY